MIIFKTILFIISITLLIKAILDDDFDNLFLAVLLFAIAFGIEKIK